MKKTLFKEKENQWCQADITLKQGKLSVSGSYGEIKTMEEAKKEAFEFWESFFEEQPEEIFSMNKKCGSHCNTPENAADYVLAVGGELHGVDVHKIDGFKVYVVHGGGQCWDEILDFFPHLKDLQEWHLNDIHAGCEHQRALGWEKEGYDKHPAEPCPTCNYKFGTEWKTIPLPHSIVQFVQHVNV